MNTETLIKVVDLRKPKRRNHPMSSEVRRHIIQRAQNGVNPNCLAEIQEYMSKHAGPLPY